ncbi:HD-GYP domain-containing protein [Desulfosporosinus burensis]
MITKLEPLTTNSFEIGELSELDLYDIQGILLLSKGKPITANIYELLLQRQLYTLQYDLENSHPPNEERRFPSSEYRFIVGYVRKVFESVCLFSSTRLIDSFAIVDKIINELEGNSRVYIDFNEFRNFDNYTYIHSVNVALIATLVGLKMGFSGQKLRTLSMGAMFHDLGKSSLPLEILNKPSGLNREEFKIIKKHPELGVEMLKYSNISKEILSIVRHHHERWNGEGYPDGLRQRAITTNAQIVAVADVFDALVADRPYRKGLPPYHALEIIVAGSGKDFDQEIVHCFERCLILYPQGSIVTLNTGEMGTVVGIHHNYPSRPLIRILFDKNGKFVNEELTCDLLKDLTRFVQSVSFNHVT